MFALALYFGTVWTILIGAFALAGVFSPDYGPSASLRRPTGRIYRSTCMRTGNRTRVCAETRDPRTGRVTSLRPLADL